MYNPYLNNTLLDMKSDDKNHEKCVIKIAKVSKQTSL